MRKLLSKGKVYLHKFPMLEKVIKKAYKNTYGAYLLRKKSKRLINNGKEVLLAVDRVFKELNKTYWIDFGTLLGAYRDKAFIGHDVDIDIAMFLHDYDENDEQVFKKHGFKKIKEMLIEGGSYGRSLTYRHENGVTLDVFFYTPGGDGWAYYHDSVPLPGKSYEVTIAELGGVVPREINLPFRGIEFIEFLGEHFPAPSPIKEHLKARYGDNFMIKDTSWRWDKAYNENTKVLSNQVAEIKYYD